METMNEHNRRSIRMKGYDYRGGGVYFVTICTKDKACTLGEIRNGIVGLSFEGCIVAEEIQKTPIIRPYVHLDRWIIMPNHIHILFRIDDHIDINSDEEKAEAGAMPRASALGIRPNFEVRAIRRIAPTPEGESQITAKLQPQSLGSIIGQIKSISTKRIRLINPDFAWQRNYYEHISRSQDETARIQRYILNNPINWTLDEEYPK